MPSGVKKRVKEFDCIFQYTGVHEHSTHGATAKPRSIIGGIAVDGHRVGPGIPYKPNPNTALPKTLISKTPTPETPETNGLELWMRLRVLRTVGNYGNQERFSTPMA